LGEGSALNLCDFLDGGAFHAPALLRLPSGNGSRIARNCGVDRARGAAHQDHPQPRDIGAWAEGWFYAKFAAVIALSGYHGWMAGYAKKLALGRPGVSSKTMRLLNEVPGVATAVIVVLVIVKPF
jgi:Uncharacterised protein family (UPF0093)